MKRYLLSIALGLAALTAGAQQTVYLKLRGACGHCPHAQMTLKNGIENILREKVDHAIVVERA